MSRLPLSFACGSLMMAGTLDTAPGHTGLMIVSGGNEIRAGAFGGQSLLAQRIAGAGFPVFRFDRRGIGDSEGENRGFRSSRRDIAAALAAFRTIAPDLDRVVAFGNCDAASALMLTGGEGFDALILSNPWTLGDEDKTQGTAGAAPPPAAIRQRYASKLKNPREVARLLRGGVDLRKLGSGLVHALGRPPGPGSLVEEMRAGLAGFEGPVSILLATGDRTAQAFDANWDRTDPRIERCEGAGHAYVLPDHREWLEKHVLAALRASR